MERHFARRPRPRACGTDAPKRPRKGMGTFRVGLVQHARGLGEPNPFSELLEFLKHFQEIGQDICPLQNSGRLSHRYTPPWPPDGEPHQGAHRQIFPCKRMNNLNQISGGMIAEPGQREAILCRGLRVIRDRRAIGLAGPHRLSGCHRQRRQSAARYQTGGQHQASDRRSTLRDGRSGGRTQRPASHLAHLAERPRAWACGVEQSRACRYRSAPQAGVDYQLLRLRNAPELAPRRCAKITMTIYPVMIAPTRSR